MSGSLCVEFWCELMALECEAVISDGVIVAFVVGVGWLPLHGVDGLRWGADVTRLCVCL